MRDLIARMLIDSGAYVNNFNSEEKWTKMPNGTVIPCYCNCRYLLSNIEITPFIDNRLTSLVVAKFPDVEVIISLATAGIYWGSLVATNLKLPFGYVRSSKKGYGMGGLVEGNPKIGAKAVIIDDALNTGASYLAAIKALEEEYKIEVLGFAGIIALCSEERREEFGKRISTLIDYKDIIKNLVARKEITEIQSKVLADLYEWPNTFNYYESLDSHN